MMLTGTIGAWCHQEARLVSEFGGKGTRAGRFSDDTAFYADRFGFLYVSDAISKRIQKFDARGNVVFEMDNSSVEGVTLRKPRALTVDAQGNIYVVDRDFVELDVSDDRPVFSYRLVVHKFSVAGEYLTTYKQPMEREMPWIDGAVSAIDPNGRTASIVQLGKLDRTVLLATTPTGNLLVHDDDAIYELDPDGALVRTFSGRGGRQGETHDANAISVDSDGTAYLADTRNHRVAVYSDDGEFVRTFGSLGTNDGEFREPTVVSAQMDGSLLVGDRAVYTRIHVSDLLLRKYDPSPRLPEAALPRQYRFSSTRLFTTLITRVGRFSPDGEFQDKILVRFPTGDYEDWHYTLRAIGADGRMYYQHSGLLTIRVYEARDGIAWNGVHRSLSMRYDVTTLSQDVDNPDLDRGLGLDADYRARGFLFRDKTLDFLVPGGTVGASAYTSLRFEYDWDERERLSASGGFYVLRSRSEQRYQAEAGLDPERSFPQDDRDDLTYDSAELQVRWERTLNQDPFRYRTMATFLNMTVGEVHNVNHAIASVNRRRFISGQRFFDWEVGLEYDLSPKFYGTISVLRGPAHGGFDGFWTYVDETGALFGRGFNEGRETRVRFQVEGYL